MLLSSEPQTQACQTGGCKRSPPSPPGKEWEKGETESCGHIPALPENPIFVANKQRWWGMWGTSSFTPQTFTRSSHGTALSPFLASLRLQS